jgi:hypothetical protein
VLYLAGNDEYDIPLYTSPLIGLKHCPVHAIGTVQQQQVGKKCYVYIYVADRSETGC